MSLRGSRRSRSRRAGGKVITIRADGGSSRLLNNLAHQGDEEKKNWGSSRPLTLVPLPSMSSLHGARSGPFTGDEGTVTALYFRPHASRRLRACSILLNHIQRLNQVGEGGVILPGAARGISSPETESLGHHQPWFCWDCNMIAFAGPFGASAERFRKVSRLSKHTRLLPHDDVR